MRRTILLLTAALAFLLPGVAFAQFTNIPVCTIAAGTHQVHTEGGNCGVAQDGRLVILSDGTGSRPDCGTNANPAGSSGGGDIPNLCIYREANSKLEPPTGGGGGSGLPSGGDVDDLIENTAPGTGAWVDPSTVNVGTASALASNPATCTGNDYVKDLDADGTLTCTDPLSGRSVESLSDVSDLRGNATGVVRTSIDESGVENNAVCFHSSGSLKDCGVQPAAAGDVEDIDTSMSAGYGILSDGTTTLTEVDLATQAELDAQVTYAEAFQGEMALLQDLGYTAPAFDFSSDTTFVMPIEWDTEVFDTLGHWRPRSQGDASSDDWQVDSLACWYPSHTYYVHVAKWCSGVPGTYSASNSEGRPCTDAGDCEGSETCNNADWNTSTSPDEVTITGHDFGTTGSVYEYSVGIEHSAGAPVHGSVSTAIQCTPGNMIADERYWIYVEDANTIIPHQDDGDGIMEPVEACQSSGNPYTCCTGSKLGPTCDAAMDCSNFQEWQGVTIVPQDDSGDMLEHIFDVNISFPGKLENSAGKNLLCMGGVNDGGTCTSEYGLGPACNEIDYDLLCTGSGTPLSCCTADGDGSSCDWIEFDQECTGSGTPFNCCLGSGRGSQCEHKAFNSMCTAADTPWTCCTGSGAGATCPGGHFDNTDGVCLEIEDDVVDATFVLGWTFPEGLDEDYDYWGMEQSHTFVKHGEIHSYSLRTAVDNFSPGMCLAALGYFDPGTSLLDEVSIDYGAQFYVTEPRRSGPERLPCDYAVSSTVGAACLYYGHLTNRGAGADVVLTLPTLKRGMDFLVSNQVEHSLSVDPNGSERFLAPDTDNDGDKMRTDTYTSSMRVYVPEDGKARVIYETGGWYDDN